MNATGHSAPSPPCTSAHRLIRRISSGDGRPPQAATCNAWDGAAAGSKISSWRTTTRDAALYTAKSALIDLISLGPLSALVGNASSRFAETETNSQKQRASSKLQQVVDASSFAADPANFNRSCHSSCCQDDANDNPSASSCFLTSHLSSHHPAFRLS